MDNAEEDTIDATPVDPSEGVDCQLGKIQFAISYDFQNSTLSLKILQATSLPAKDFTGTSDPYVKILLLPDKKHKLMTKVKKKNLNPRWNECFLFEGMLILMCLSLACRVECSSIVISWNALHTMKILQIIK